MNRFQKKKGKQFFFLLPMICFFILFRGTTVQAIDIPVKDEAGLESALNLPSFETDTIILTESFNLNKRLVVKSNKIIDMNGKTITAKKGLFAQSGGFNIESAPNFTKFIVKNGKFIGGPTDSNTGAYLTVDNKAGLFYSPKKNYVNVEFQDITHDGDGFFKGRSADVTFKGKVTLNNTAFNVRALNMTMYANPNDVNDPENTDFYGYVNRPGSADPYAQGYGGFNLTFDGYADESAKSVGRPTKNLNIPKHAKVKLLNDKADGYLEYSNNVGNFAQINVEGEFIAEAQGSSLRTTSAFSRGDVGTPTDQSEVNVKPGSTFKVSTTNEKNTYGVIYTYNVDINVDNAKIFDIRNFGNGVFFHGWFNAPHNNFRIFNSNIAVWEKAKKGVGNPLGLWQDVNYLKLEGFHDHDTTATLQNKLTTSNPEIKSKFNINEFSRISNDIKLPIILPDKEFQSNEKVILKNNATTFYGSTDYYLPDGSLVGQPSPGAILTLDISGKKYTTVADGNGDWKFDNLDLSTVKGGTIGKLDLTDTDKRIAKSVSVVIEDKVPPKATPKLIKAKLNDMTNLTNPKDAFASYGDETTSNTQLKFEYVTSLEDREEMVKKVGKYEVEAKVTDEAGNPTVITAPVIVHELTEVITNGFISGNNFEVDYDKWNSATDAEKRNIMLAAEYGDVKGYEIQGNDVTEVTSNPSKMTMSFSGFTWEPKKTYEIQVKVLSYTKKIKVTLVPAAVKMNVKQVYKDTDTAIYKDLATNTPVDNTPKYDVKIGDSIEDVVKNLIDSGKIKMNYTGYNDMAVSSYQVKVDGQVIQTTKVPDKPFELIYGYQGQMIFEQAPNLNFGKVKVSSGNTRTKLDSKSQDEVKIINTFLNDDWTLKAALPKGIKNKKTDEDFLGKLIYIDSVGKEHPVTSSGTKLISQGSTDKSLSTVDVRGTDDSGMRLEQHIGNSRDEYSGELIWSLEDTP